MFMTWVDIHVSTGIIFYKAHTPFSLPSVFLLHSADIFLFCFLLFSHVYFLWYTIFFPLCFYARSFSIIYFIPPSLFAYIDCKWMWPMFHPLALIIFSTLKTQHYMICVQTKFEIVTTKTWCTSYTNRTPPGEVLAFRTETIAYYTQLIFSTLFPLQTFFMFNTHHSKSHAHLFPLFWVGSYFYSINWFFVH